MEVLGMGEPVLFWGATGQAIALHEFLREDHALVAVVDRDPGVASPFPGVPVLRDLAGVTAFLDTFGLPRPGFVVAIGGAKGLDRVQLSLSLAGLGLRPLRAVHPTAWIAKDAEVGMGLQAMAGSRIGARARLGDWVLINTGASVDHEGVLGHGVHLAPGAILCGCVEIGEGAMIGAGAVVLPRVRVGAHAVVGAGSVVVHDVPAGVVALGSPARVTRTLEETP
jgi:sugar O-acyltransferase (sialic acid O-acetyltransferase NeuD family)